MAIPANGTLSLIANVSGGIEPIFAYLTKQNIQGTTVHQLQPTFFKKLLNAKNVDAKLIFNELMVVKIEFIEWINHDMKNILIDANSLTTEEHTFNVKQHSKDL